MMLQKIKKFAGNLLLFFVIFSIGFAVGREATRKQAGSSGMRSASENQVVVYYLRSSFRCWQCNLIEQHSDTLIRNDFSEYLDEGQLDWVVVDYLQNDELADRYNISGNTVIVARYVDGSEVAHNRLDKVMEKVFDRDVFMSYVGDAIEEMINH